MWNYECNETEIMNLRDSMEGVVRKQNSSGLYMYLSSRRSMLSKQISRQKLKNRRSRKARENRKILVNVDSIAYESDMKRAA